MWTRFISRLALFTSVIWTIVIWGSGFIVATSEISLMYTNPLEYIGVIAVYNIIWVLGVAFIYVIAWMLTGKNVLPTQG